MKSCKEMDRKTSKFLCDINATKRRRMNLKNRRCNRWFQSVPMRKQTLRTNCFHKVVLLELIQLRAHTGVSASALYNREREGVTEKNCLFEINFKCPFQTTSFTSVFNIMGFNKFIVSLMIWHTWSWINLYECVLLAFCLIFLCLTGDKDYEISKGSSSDPDVGKV